jgi:hypothetical protein
LLAQHTRLTTPDHISGQERHPIHVLEKLD